MRDFEVWFDHGEPSAVESPAFRPYGNLGFPEPRGDRPWIYSNFVQSLDGIVSFKGRHAAGSDISQSPEDRWLMDLLRAHADAVLLGVNTLVEERHYMDPNGRGPIFKIANPEMLDVRKRLGLARFKNIFVTASASIQLSE